MYHFNKPSKICLIFSTGIIVRTLVILSNQLTIEMNKKTQESAPDSTQQTPEQHNTADAPAAEVKKKAGRPSKAKTAEIVVSSEPVAIFGRKKRPAKAASTAGTAKKAGRPAKVKVEATEKSVSTAEKKRPGRPKVEKPAVASVAAGEKKRPGRPKVEKPAVASVAAGEKKRPGRPKVEKPAVASVAAGEKKRPGRPKIG
ncbi:MAG: hypothetical protein ACKV1O_27680, partial [Saprospiraceae bacterium]